MTTKAQQNPVYSIEALSKRREKGGAVFKLVADKLQIYPGEFVAVVGPSGCGKSTLLDILGLVLQPDEVELFQIECGLGDGRSVIDLMEAEEAQLASIRKKHVGYILQNGGLFSFLTVAENIRLTAEINKIEEIEQRLEKITDYLGIDGQLHKKPGELSGGQRQRAAIARALIHRPAIVLADEPTAAVDRPTAVEICKQFKLLTSEFNVSVLMVTHDEALVAPLVDRVISFELTKKGADQTVSEVIEKNWREADES